LPAGNGWQGFETVPMTSPQLSEALAAVDITSMPRYLQHGYPWADWDLLRDAAPVYWYEGRPRFSPFWAVTRYDDVRFVSSHPELFSNRGVIRVDTDNGLARLETYKRKRAERYGWEPNVALDMIYTDRPEHLDLRSMAVRRFTPRAMNRLADHLDQMAQHFVAEFVAAARRAAPAPIDVVENLSVGLPIATICGLLGVPVDTWPTIRRWSDQTLLTPDMSHPDVRPGETPSDVRRRAGQEYHEYRQQLIDRARAAAVAATATTASGDDGGADGFDIVSRLAQATVDGRPLDDQRFHGYLELLVGGGNETTRNTITGGLQALLQHPDQAALLAADPNGLIETAAEEILRWVSPVIQFARTATTNTTVGGQRIHPGDTLVLWYPSANRDGRQFPDPYRFDLRRYPNAHVTFGHGEHFCLGANLARWELRAVFRALAPYLANLRLAGEPERMPGLHVGAVRQLLVRWTTEQ
jgi:cholest-4-en-3-one 26-monooxygenase